VTRPFRLLNMYVAIASLVVSVPIAFMAPTPAFAETCQTIVSTPVLVQGIVKATGHSYCSPSPGSSSVDVSLYYQGKVVDERSADAYGEASATVQYACKPGQYYATATGFNNAKSGTVTINC